MNHILFWTCISRCFTVSLLSQQLSLSATLSLSEVRVVLPFVFYSIRTSRKLNFFYRFRSSTSGIKGRYPREVSLIVIIKQVSGWLSLIIKLFHHLSLNLSNSVHDSPDQTDERIKIYYNLRSSHPTPPWLPAAVAHRSVHQRHRRRQSVLKNHAPVPSPDAVSGIIALSQTFVAPAFTAEVSLWHQVLWSGLFRTTWLVSKWSSNLSIRYRHRETRESRK